MPKGYWIAHVDADNAENFKTDAYQAYVSGAGPIFEKYNGNFLARGGDFLIAEGQNLGSRHVVIEFPSFEVAKDCYNCADYQKARKHRTPISNAAIMLVEGLDN